MIPIVKIIREQFCSDTNYQNNTKIVMLFLYSMHRSSMRMTYVHCQRTSFPLFACLSGRCPNYIYIYILQWLILCDDQHGHSAWCHHFLMLLPGLFHMMYQHILSCQQLNQVNAAGDLCAICQEKMHAPILLRCKHIFCEDCVSEWSYLSPPLSLCI